MSEPVEVTAEQLGEFVREAVRKEVDNIRRPKRALFAPDDDLWGPVHSGPITMPVSWCKGNLPVPNPRLSARRQKNSNCCRGGSFRFLRAPSKSSP